ncbi:MAG: MFS transporter [Timaviella obliquedivisa GSE-PSE-MK23-08B]|jgi:predicted MFS family arabinose efflux permease|nr:MFS transporter [Timaviella obliquedivisa GSE-PSE-MK23-08B]
MSGGVVPTVLPEMKLELVLDPQWVGMLVSTHALTSALSTPLFGILADRVGKLRVMLPCLLLYAIAGTAPAFLTNFSALILSRAILGVASGGVAAATIGFLGSMYDGEARTRILGYATSAMATSAIVCPLLSGWVGQTHWQHAFYIYGLGLPMAIVAAVFLKKSTRSSSVIEGDTKKLRRVLVQPNVLRLYLFIMVAAAIVYAVVIYTPLYLKEAIGADPQLNGFVLAVRLVGVVLVSAFGASQVSRQLGQARAIALGFSFMAMTLATIPVLTQLYLIIPAAVLFGVGFGIITPNLYDALAIESPPELRTSVLAIGTGCNSLGQFISPVLLGLVWNYAGLPTVFYATAGLAMVASFVSLIENPQKRMG